MDLGNIDPQLINLFRSYVVPGTVIGSIIGVAIAVRIGGGWNALADLVRALRGK